MYFCLKALRPAFDEKWIPKFEQEINRMFRTNAFNFTQRKQHYTGVLEKHPVFPPNFEILTDLFRN
jgi:hypothetical protein